MCIMQNVTDIYRIYIIIRPKSVDYEGQFGRELHFLIFFLVSLLDSLIK